MPPVPDDAFRTLLAECSTSAFTEFVADLWQARGRDVRRDGDHLLVGDRELWPVLEPDAGPTSDDVVVVAATDPPADAAERIIAPADLYQVLLYDVPREQATEVFEAHFGRPLDDDWTDATGSTPDTSSGNESDTTADAIRTPSHRPGSGQRVVWVPIMLPRDVDDIRTILGDRRIQIVSITLLVVGLATGWGLFLYQPPATASESPFATGDQPVPFTESYRAVSQLHVQGEEETFSVGRSYTYASGDPAVAVDRLTSGGIDDRRTLVNYAYGNRSYVRHTYTDPSKYAEIREGREKHENFVRANEATLTFYTAARTNRPVEAGHDGEFPVLALAIFDYEQQGTTSYEGRDVVRFVPTTGWVTRETGTNQSTIYVRNTSGEVLVDEATDAVLYADVEAEIVHTVNWAGVLTEPAQDVHIRYRVDPDVDRPEPPAWVDGLTTNATAKTDSR